MAARCSASPRRSVFRSTRRGRSCPRRCTTALLYGIERKIPFVMPPGAKKNQDAPEGKEFGFGGIARRIER